MESQVEEGSAQWRWVTLTWVKAVTSSLKVKIVGLNRVTQKEIGFKKGHVQETD